MLSLFEKTIFYLLVFFLPFQTRKIIYQFTDSFNEWQAIFVFLTDFLIWALILSWAWRLRKKRFLKNLGWGWLRKKIIQPLDLVIVLFLLIGFISLRQAVNISLGFFVWFKLLEFILFFFYLKNNFQFFDLTKVVSCWIGSGVFQSLIGIGQFIQQKSLGLRYLGESILRPDLAGVAKIDYLNQKIIRAYGTFPHPNVLAVFLMVALLFFYFLWLKNQFSWRKKVLLLITYFLLLTGLFFTFSRGIILVFLVLVLLSWLFFFKKAPQKIMGLILFSFLIGFVLIYFYWPLFITRWHFSLVEQSVKLRIFYQEMSFQLIKEFPFLGIGIGQFVSETAQRFDLIKPWVHQPVHNLYLLIASELGLIGLFVFLWFILLVLVQFFSFWKRRKEISLERLNFGLITGLLCLGFLMIGLFDHFFWTLHQGQLIFWFIFGLWVNLNRSPG